MGGLARYDPVGNFGEWCADFTQTWDYEASTQPVQHPLILGIAGARAPELRYIGDEVNDGIGFRCAR